MIGTHVGAHWLLSIVTLLVLSLGMLACSPDEDCAQCTAGESRCSPDQRSIYLCKKLESTGCYQTVSKACLPGESCEMVNGKATCRSEAVTCMSACQLNSRKCEGGQPYLCAKAPTDVCPQWKPQGACADGESCDSSTGSCAKSGCKATKPETEKRCVGKAVHWFDDCGKQGAQIGTCKDTEDCKAGKCVPVGCVPNQSQHQKRCENNAVYWYDDCGQKGALVQNCNANQECRGGVCLTRTCTPTNPRKEKRCEGNSLYWYDDCGKKGTKAQDCTANEECKSDACVPKGCTPTNPKKEKRCVGNEVYWYNDCGQKGALAMQCTSDQKCDAGKCIPKSCTPTNNQTTKRCVGNELFWFDDCGQKRALIESCQAPKTCQNQQCTCKVTTQQATRRCIGKSIYWFDNCANRGSLIQTCSASEKCENATCKQNNQCPVSHACSMGETRCQGNSVQNCVTNPQSFCRTWSTVRNCPSGLICQGGQCIVEPRKCSVGIGGTCSSNSECCQGQTCRSVLVSKVCSPCNTNADCPKMSGFLPTTCCNTLGIKYCSLVCF